MTWEVTMMAIRKNGTFLYKVTRRLPSMSVAETKLFTSKEEAERLFEDWLNQ